MDDLVLVANKGAHQTLQRCHFMSMSCDVTPCHFMSMDLHSRKYDRITVCCNMCEVPQHISVVLTSQRAHHWLEKIQTHSVFNLFPCFYLTIWFISCQPLPVGGIDQPALEAEPSPARWYQGEACVLDVHNSFRTRQ